MPECIDDKPSTLAHAWLLAVAQSVIWLPANNVQMMLPVTLGSWGPELSPTTGNTRSLGNSVQAGIRSSARAAHRKNHFTVHTMANGMGQRRGRLWWFTCRAFHDSDTATLIWFCSSDLALLEISHAGTPSGRAVGDACRF